MKPMQYEGTIFMENNLRIEAMDKLGIDLQLLSPNPLTMFHESKVISLTNFVRFIMMQW